ncbi:MAG: DnaB-like helicase C-terminal domain-containing protein, partial [Candidatus Anammoxibacter sp.]
VSGPRKSGKTLFAQTLTHTFFNQDLGCLWFSYELTPRQFFRAFGSEKLPIFFMPQKNKAHDLEWIKDRIIESIAKYGVSVVFIDHLHFLFDIAKSRNASIEIGQVIRFLKGIAIDLNIVIFVLCHMNNIQPGIEPTDVNFRDSSFVASESDTGLIIWRVLNSPDQAWLKICYSRRTGAWEEKIPLIKVNGLLREAELDNGHIH